MAWTTPGYWAVGETLTATDMNVHLSGNSLYLHDRITASMATSSAPVSMGSGTNWYDTTSVSLAAGTWAVWAQASFSGANQDDYYQMRIRNTTDTVDYASGLDDLDGTRKLTNFMISTLFTISGTKTVKSQTWVSVGGSNCDNASMIAVRFAN